MAENKTILELNEVTANASGDTFVVVQGGVTQKTTLSKIKTFFDTIYTTTSAVATQISSALTNYATQTFATNAANEAQSNANQYTNDAVALKQNKQSIEIFDIDASVSTSTINISSCILSVTNIPSGTGNKTITIKVDDGALSLGDVISTSLIYHGFDVNLRSWAIVDVGGGILLKLYINVHSSPTEPVLIAINKMN